ncbi:MAG TPA: hypothetical protein QGF58_05585 [Myxococcota bacterium]|nr:hypothetical protein [Myxococcota bacterium]
MSSLLLDVALAGPVVVDLPQGQVDWTEGRLMVRSAGDPNTGAWSDVKVAEQAALAQLELRLVEQAGTLAYDSERLAGELGAELEGAWRITQTTYHTSGLVELEAELDLHEWLRGTLVEDAAGERDGRTSTLSGVLVDARDVPAEPCLAPRLLGPDLSEVFGAASMATEAAARRRPVTWVGDPADPPAGDRIGESPLVLIAAGAKGCDIVLDEEGAGRLRQLAGTSVLADGHVVVVVEP